MISVLLRTRNEEQHIGYCLQSIHDNIPNAEVIIGNNNSTDDTMSIVQLFDYMDIKVVNVDSYTPGKSLNMLVDHSTCDTVLVLSAHCKLLPTTTNYTHIAMSSLHGNMACFGKQIPIYKGKRITPRYIWSHFGDKNVINIEEFYAIGPAISLMMDGYFQKDKLISLRGTLVPATTLNKVIGSLPLLGDILVGKKTGEGVFGVSFKIKGPPKKTKTTVNPIKTLTPRFITRTLEKIKKSSE